MWMYLSICGYLCTLSLQTHAHISLQLYVLYHSTSAQFYIYGIWMGHSLSIRVKPTKSVLILILINSIILTAHGFILSSSCWQSEDQFSLSVLCAPSAKDCHLAVDCDLWPCHLLPAVGLPLHISWMLCMF